MKKKFVIFSCIGCLIIIFLASILIIDKVSDIKLTNMKKNYDYNEFNKLTFKVKTSSLLISKKKTVWNINGYDFYQGSKSNSVPVVVGENKLTIRNADKVKEYTFNVTGDDILLIPELKVEYDDIDFDLDGLTNKEEKELGLSTYTNDTDGDGLLDNVELVLNTDPLKKDKYNEERNYKVYANYDESSKIYLDVTAKGNVANTFLDIKEDENTFDSDFLQSKIVAISTTSKENPSMMKINFEKTVSNDDYSIYAYDNVNNKLTELKTTYENGIYKADAMGYNILHLLGKKSKAPKKFKVQIEMVIDNSGSMYLKEYVEEKTGQKIKDDEADGYGNDVEFKRLDLMKSLVQKLGTKDYSYGLFGYTDSVCEMSDLISDEKEILTKINTLKTDCQEFYGTNTSRAIRKAVNKIDKNVIGDKFIIVLTDGKDTGLFNFKLSSYELNSIKKKGIRIITIGLGNVDSEYLIDIANKTNGKYLFVKDANALDKLVEIIQSSIEEILDEDENIIMADSGFRANVDGFSFSNFGSEASPGGVCFGMSSVTKKIYLNKLEKSQPETRGITILMGDLDTRFVGYELTERNQKRLVKGNTYNIKFDKIYGEFNSGINIPDDYRVIENDVAIINSKYKQDIIDHGYNIKTINVEATVNDVTVGQRETMGNLNCYDANVKDEYKDDYQILQIVERNQKRQYFVVPLILSELIEKKGVRDSTIKTIINMLSNGEPVMIGINAKEGGHSVLGTKITKEKEEDIYYLNLYDSNAPGEEGIAKLTRQVIKSDKKNNSIYTFTYSKAGFDFYLMGINSLQ